MTARTTLLHGLFLLRLRDLCLALREPAINVQSVAVRMPAIAAPAQYYGRQPAPYDAAAVKRDWWSDRLAS
jgi:hypothetical protein